MSRFDVPEPEPQTAEWEQAHEADTAPRDKPYAVRDGPPLPEEADAERASRMTAAQLRDRIEQMEASEAAGRGKPGQRIARRAKLEQYRAELARHKERDRAARADTNTDRQAALHHAIDSLLQQWPCGDIVEATWDRDHERRRR